MVHHAVFGVGALALGLLGPHHRGVDALHNHFGLPFVKVQNGTGVFRHFRNGQEVTIGLAMDGDGVGQVDLQSAQGSAPLSTWEDILNVKFETNALTIKEKLSKQEVTKIPWPSADWPVYLDGINYKWNKNEPSATAKYAMAQGLDVQQFLSAASLDGGVEQSKSFRDTGGPCSANDDCAKEPYLFMCGKASDAAKGVCIARYYGICDGWTSASILEEEPKCPVTINGVTFRVLDIKALLSHVYIIGDAQVLTSGSQAGIENPETLDEYGRYIDPARRDVDPHKFHILLTNVIGRLRKSLILDIDPGIPTFNYALRSYSIQETKLMQPNAAATQFFKTAQYSVFNTDAVQVQYVKMRVKYIHEGYEDGPLVSNAKAINAATKELVYEYLLELDAANQIIGGEWVNDSKKQHPDIVWLAYTKPIGSTTGLGITYDYVSKLVKKSLEGTC